MGVLPRSGIGEAMEFKKCISEQQLLEEARKGNRAVRKRARGDEHAAELHALAMADALLGRMTATVPADAGKDEGRVLTPRFAVVRGCKADGTPRVRSIDDCTASRINRATQPQEKMRHNTVDALFEVAKRISQVLATRARSGAASARCGSRTALARLASIKLILTRPSGASQYAPTTARMRGWPTQWARKR